MDKYEEAVLEYIIGDPNRFVRYQMDIPYDNEEKCGGSCPDFVAIDFNENTIYIVEVTVASDTKAVIAKIKDRESRWYKPLRKLYDKYSPNSKGWDYRVTLFVRNEEHNSANRVLESYEDVSVKSIDEALFSWNWDWKDGKPKNLLRNVK
jgi:hypothetical protein